MSYGRVEPTHTVTSHRRRRRWFIILGITAAVLLLICLLTVPLVVRFKPKPSSSNRTPTLAISQTCALTRFPALCIESLLDSPGAIDAGELGLLHISLNLTHHRVGKALYDASAVTASTMDFRSRAAYDDCMELLDDSLDHLSRSLTGGDSDDDVLTWLSAALTNQDTCAEGLDGAGESQVSSRMREYMKDLSELVSNCLAIFSAVSSKNKDFGGVPIQNRKRRRRLMTYGGGGAGEFPEWVKGPDRRLLEIPASAMQADIVVSKDGNGNYKSIAEAVKAAPEHSSRRFVIYVKEGRYDENIKVGRKNTNLMFVGDGKGKTIVSGGRSVLDGYTTFHTATFASSGAGFIMRDMTVENWAGPAKHQAVALRVGADHAVVYRCSIIGYQDTLYVHSQRQFFRECDVSGTVDFVFGNAAVVLQSCSLWARKPLPSQKNTVTAQNRKDPNQNTGISIHNCRVLATPDLEAAGGAFSTYLGRPWKMYSRVVVMLSYLGGHVSPAGWLEWNAAFALDTLYYGEYMNYGPGAGVAGRVTWPGYRVITEPEEASKFTVGRFISGSSWLPSTGVAFLAGLTL